MKFDAALHLITGCLNASVVCREYEITLALDGLRTTVNEDWHRHKSHIPQWVYLELQHGLRRHQVKGALYRITISKKP